MSNRRRAKAPNTPLGGPNEPTAWMRGTIANFGRALADATPEIEPEPGTVVIGYLNDDNQDDCVCDRCGGPCCEGDGPNVGIAPFAHPATGAVAFGIYGICDTCDAKEVSS